MLVDANEIETGRSIDADLCIIGAGAAGITLAREFAGSKIDVCLLEGGPIGANIASQSLYSSVSNVGRDYSDLYTSRRRFFGGSTNCWTGHCMSLRAVNFEKQSWSRYTGWPISLADLQPYHLRAEAILGLDEDTSDPTAIAARLGQSLLPFDPERVSTLVSRYNAVRFGQAFREELEDAPNVKVVLNANVNSIEAHKGGHGIQRLAVRTLAGRGLDVRAKAFVLATGGIENARMLLASRSVHVNGLGNEFDMVGRFFMTHIRYQSGLILPARPKDQLGLYLQELPIGKIACHAELVLPEEEVKRGGIPDIRVSLKKSHTLRYSEAVKSSQHLRAEVAKFHWPDDIATDLANMIQHPVEVFSAATGRAGPLVYELSSTIEPVPNPASRIKLAEEKDALGIPVATLDWRLSDADRLAVKYAHACIAREVGRSGFGRMFIDLPEAEPQILAGAHGDAHHMGATRMHDSPRLGVVDKDCRVHGIENLFVAGSSVFPTVGCAGPTFTIVALAARLGDHIKGGFMNGEF